jgi:putative ABC transport system substrate-binding protein
MRRRTVLRFVSALIATSRLPANAQPSGIPFIGFLNSADADQWAPFVAAFKQGLTALGYAEVQNVAIEFRWAEGNNERLPALAAELVARGAAVLVVSGGTPPILAARKATQTVPVVFMTGDDPVEAGFVRSMDRPGANMTGVTIFRVALGAEPLHLLREFVSPGGVIGVLVSAINPGSEAHGRNIEQAARALGQEIVVARASSAGELDDAVANLVRRNIRALIVTVSPLFISQRERLVALAGHYRLPAIYPVRGFVEAGGLISYGADLRAAYRELGMQTAQVLRGARPSELPIRQSMKRDLVINRGTAKALGLAVPQTLLTQADEVIE